MKRSLISLVALVVTLCCQGCSAWRPLAENAGSRTESVEVGQHIRVVDSTGRTLDLRVTAVGAGFIEGAAEGCGEPIRVARDDIDTIARRERAPGKTVGLVVGLIAAHLVVGAGIEGAGAAAILSSAP
jgi:hypothetical protein